jgi:imidazolonepropionase-like amidohydrolase
MNKNQRGGKSMPREIVLRNAQVIDGVSDQPRKNISIVMKDDRIASVTEGDGPAGQGAEIVDCSGKTVMAGLIDTHVHSTFIDRNDPDPFSRYWRHYGEGCRGAARQGVAAARPGEFR